MGLYSDARSYAVVKMVDGVELMWKDEFGRDDKSDNGHGRGGVRKEKNKTSARYGVGSNQTFDLESTNLQCMCNKNRTLDGTFNPQ